MRGGCHIESRRVRGLRRRRDLARADAAALRVVPAVSRSAVVPLAMGGVTDGGGCGRTRVRRLHHPPAEPGGEEQEEERNQSGTSHRAPHGTQATSSPTGIKGEGSRRGARVRVGGRRRARPAQSRAANTSASTPANQSGVRTSFFTSHR